MRTARLWGRLAALGVGAYFLYEAATAPSGSDAIVMLVLGVLAVLLIAAVVGGIGIGGFLSDKVLEHEKDTQQRETRP